MLDHGLRLVAEPEPGVESLINESPVALFGRVFPQSVCLACNSLFASSSPSPEVGYPGKGAYRE
jgi:hypothetical protein